MVKYGCKFDFSDFHEAVESFKAKVVEKEHMAGKAAVGYAKEHGSYHDVTGRLRASNDYKADGSGLAVFNTAPYASDVEARGCEVVSGAALLAESIMKGEMQ